MKRFLKRFFFRNSQKKNQKSNSSVYTKDLLQGDYYDIGEFSYGHPKVLHWDEGSRLEIGKFCSIADNTTILLGGNHRVDWISTYPFMEFSQSFPMAKSLIGHPVTNGDLIIGNDVWIGYGATILSGITISDGAVVGSQTVVTKDVGPYEIIVGNPGRIIRKRFNQDDIDFLLKIKWWDWPVEKINECSHLLCSNKFNELKKFLMQ